jgi:hypothetical protein
MKTTFTALPPLNPNNLDLSLTSAFGDYGLGEHFAHCKKYGSRFLVVRCIAESLKNFLATRLITSAVVVCVFIGLSSLAV